MKDLSFQSFCDLLEQMSAALLRALRQGGRALSRMSWPQLLAACIVMALVLSILPLALFLFTCFLLLKILIAGSVIGLRKKRRPAAPPHLPQPDPDTTSKE
ncbi:hypothetical protein [Massilia sp. TS11]|uniref:hypothetical protein n=1 Tax=Massilia sp. TS11 TaxID=2908003 RepID=UPI001EDBB0A8|nr:hypothetical protein [Massilia sp. TS11]MCG2586055.1 hypothetical protein [Massilia sp. TS11]